MQQPTMIEILKSHGTMCGLLINVQAKEIRPIYRQVFSPLPYFINEYRVMPTLYDGEGIPANNN